MKDSSKILLAMGLGTIAGGIAGYYLNSDEGRHQRKVAAKAAKKRKAEASAKIEEVTEQAKTVINDLSAKAKDYIAQVSNKAEETMDEAQSSFQKGMEKAKNKAKQVEKAVANGAISAN
jgi:gas vesicle protein